MCEACAPRYVGDWQLSETGKHQWCRVCAAQTDVVRELRGAIGLGKTEYQILKAAGELDANGAALYTCDECPEALCSVCLMRLFSLEAMLEAKASDNWKCPACTGAEMLPPQPRKRIE